MVFEEGFEPSRLAAADFKSVASASSATQTLLVHPEGFEPSRLTALVPKTSVSAIPPRVHKWYA